MPCKPGKIDIELSNQPFSLSPEATSKANRTLNDVSSNYDSIKNKVIQTHDAVEHHAKDISNKFKSKNIYIGL